MEVHDVGRLDDGSCFVVLELIEGRTLQEEIKQGKLSQERAWEVMLHVTAAIQHAHARGLVHRDLKPANILLDADGNAHVADFGLAISDQAQVKKASDVSGTPAYMAPEQVQGDAHQLDGRADIWAIGVILYELFTGRRPFRGEDRETLFDEIVHRAPKPPRQIDPNIPPSLERVCLKCLSKSISDRYLSAADVSRALRHAQFAPQRKARRFRITAAVAIVILLAIGGLWAYLASIADEPLITVDPESGLTIRPLATLRGHTREVWSAAFSSDDKTLYSGGVDKVIKIWDTDDFHERGELVGHEGEVRSVCCSPDGRVLASAGNDKTIVLWDIDKLQPQRAIVEHSDDVRSVAFSPEGDALLSGSVDKTVRAWNPDTGDEQRLIVAGEAAVQCVAYSPDGTFVAVGGDDRTVHLYDSQTGDELRKLGGHGDGVCYIAFSPDGTRMASASWDKTARVWDVAAGDQLLALDGHEDGIRCVAFSPDGRRLVTGSSDRTIKVWDAETGTELATLCGHSKPVTCVAFSSDGTILASASGDKTVRLWEIEVEEGDTPDEPAEPSLDTIAKPSPEPPELISFELAKPDATDMLTGLVAEPVDLPGVGRWQIESVFPRTQTTSVAWSPDGKEIACGTYAGWVRIYDVTNGQLVRILNCRGHLITGLAYRPTGEPLLAVACHSSRGQIEVWRTDGKLVRRFGDVGYMKLVVWSLDGEWLAGVRHTHPVQLWKVDGTAGPVLGDVHHQTVAWSPDGATLATSGPNERIDLWQRDGTRLATLIGHENLVFSLAWSPDGRLASASHDNTIRLWNVDNTPGPVLEGGGWVDDISWRPDGTLLASAGLGGIMLWSKDGRPGGTSGVRVRGQDTIDWSPDGERLVFGNTPVPFSSVLRRQVGFLSKEGEHLGTLTDGHVQSRLWCAPQGNRIATIGDDGYTRLFDTNGGAIGASDVPKSWDPCLAWSPDGDRCATGHGGTIQFWDCDGSKPSGLGRADGIFISSSSDVATSLSWSPNGDFLAVGQELGGVQLLDADGNARPVLKGHDAPVWRLAWSPDGRWLLSLDSHGRLILRQHTGETQWTVDLLEVTTHTPDVNWSPDGEWFAIRYSVGMWRVHNVRGDRGSAFKQSSPMAWRPDGRLMAVTCRTHGADDEILLLAPDGNVVSRLYSPRLNSQLTLASDNMNVSLDWNEDGRRLVSAGHDSTIVMWDTETGHAEWVTLLINNGKSVTISAAGEIIDGDPESIEQQLVYLVEQPDGSTELLSHSEFYQRVEAARSKVDGGGISSPQPDRSSLPP